MAMYTLFFAVDRFLRLISAAILVYCIMSWIAPNNRFYVMLERFVNPFIQPFRKLSMKLMARTGMRIDFSPWFTMIALNLLTEVLWTIYRFLPRGLR